MSRCHGIKQRNVNTRSVTDNPHWFAIDTDNGFVILVVVFKMIRTYLKIV